MLQLSQLRKEGPTSADYAILAACGPVRQRIARTRTVGIVGAFAGIALMASPNLDIVTEVRYSMGLSNPSFGTLSNRNTRPRTNMTSIFSTYSTGENRVTASILAVLRSLSLSRIERILASLLEQSEFELVRFQNQPAQGSSGVPDAIIQSSIRLLLETKTVRNAVRLAQIRRHLVRLDESNEANQLLLVLTPDDGRPASLDEVADPRVAWTSFSLLDQAIDEILEDKREVVSEREAFLLRELQDMLGAEGLLANPNDVVVVAARNAWPEYNQFHAYVCQPNRSFQQVIRMGFYSKGVIYPLVPQILESIDEVQMTTGLHKGVLGALVDRLVADKLRIEGESYKVMFLSAPDSPDTLKLANPIPNDKKDKAGKPTAFTMGQRYVGCKTLLQAKTTSDFD